MIVAVMSWATGACGGSDSQSIRVLAASSLTDAFAELASAFEASDDGVDISVELVVAGSSSLATQVTEGAPADVVATADEATMARIVDSGRTVGEPAVFAENSLVLAVSPDAADRITGLDDLPGALVATCAPQVPCGQLALRLLDASGVRLEPTTEEPNVRSVLTKVLLGEVDAGLVYATDVRGVSSDDLLVVIPPEAPEITTRYPVVAISDDPVAAAFVEFVTSADGARILDRYGFTVSAA